MNLELISFFCLLVSELPQRAGEKIQTLKIKTMRNRKSKKTQITQIFSIVIKVTTLAGLLTPFASAQTQIQIPANKDNTLYESSIGEFSNGAGQYFFVGTTAKSERRRGLLAFDIAGNIPASSTINSVTLRLHMSRTISGEQFVKLHRVLAD